MLMRNDVVKAVLSELKAIDFTYFHFLSHFYFLLFPFSTIFYFKTWG